MLIKSRFPSKISLPNWPIAQILEFTTPSSTWLVGGTVRDLLLERPLHDWDFVTTENGIKLARKVANHFKGAFYVLDQSRETGRAVVVPPSSSTPLTLDFATLRAESLTADLHLRDFTINAMAMSLTGQVIDPLHCQDDLAKETIRMTTPDCFTQDPVRLLRAVRQSHSLGFNIDEATYAAIRQQAHLINTISAERILAEMCAILDHKVTADAVSELEATTLFRHIVPELQPIPSQQTSVGIWEQTIRMLSKTDRLLQNILNKGINLDQFGMEQNDEGWQATLSILVPFHNALLEYLNTDVNVGINHAALLRWAILLHRVPVESTRQRLVELRMPNKSIRYICKLIQVYPVMGDFGPDVSRSKIFQFFQQAEQAAPGAILLSLAHASTAGDMTTGCHNQLAIVNHARKLLQVFFEEPAEYLNPTPFLGGEDLLNLGVPSGPVVGRILNSLLLAQISGEVTSRSSAVEFVLKQIQGQQ